MIILDAEDQLRTKQLRDPFLGGGPTLRFPEKAAARSNSPLPDYETSEAHQKLILKENIQRKRVDPRLWRAILYALAIYVILSAVIGVPIIIVKRRKNTDDMAYGIGPIWDGDDDPGTSLSLSNSNPWLPGVTAKCDWDDIEHNDSHNYSATVTRFLSCPGTLYIRSNISQTTTTASFSLGHLTVDINPDPSALKTMFRVDAVASTKELLRHTTACFDESGNDRGLFIGVSKKLKPTDFVGLDIQVLLPKTISSNAPLNFFTYLPWFSHGFGDLKNYTTFTNLVIEGAGFDVVARSVKASLISVKNSYGSILGEFHAIDSLTLDGIKGDIIANITLERDPASLGPTFLTLDTGDGAIDARVKLVAASPRYSFNPSQPYTFVADVKTFNGPLNIQVAHSSTTPPIPLQLTVQNNDGKTVVVVDKSFEGTYSAQSKLEKVAVEQPYMLPSADPLGKGRSRNYKCDQKSVNRVRGWVGWGKQPKYGDGVVQGQIKVVSSLSPIMLDLGSGTGP
ncbi:hypothetical protein Hypma_007705 [Hypsizygus marmoreus]|uniref:DUF7330 domain-containing protein n=1 Tax=Hypsizygus marmoreus TaxID=39966 RepID=A0A369K0U1_HYPMA|nr:hypothetical protein Hypma_007705 [Hypsizygus marmoreus]